MLRMKFCQKNECKKCKTIKNIGKREIKLDLIKCFVSICFGLLIRNWNDKNIVINNWLKVNSSLQYYKKQVRKS